MASLCGALSSGVRPHFEHVAVVCEAAQWRRDREDAFASVTTPLPTSGGLSTFQQRAMEALAEYVPSDTFHQVAMDSESGSYLHAPLGVKGSELYLYPNEAAIFGATPYAWFEEWVRTPEELIDALAKECSSRAA